MIKMIRVGVLAVAGAMMSCATMGGLPGSKDAGTTEVYPVTEDQAWEISRAVLKWNGADKIDSRRSEGYMAADLGWRMFTYGTLAAVWVYSDGSDRTKVTALTRRRLALSVSTKLTQKGFHRAFAKGVALVQRGAELPKDEPD